MIGTPEIATAGGEPPSAGVRPAAAIVLRRVRVHFGDQPVLRGVDLEVAAGTRLALLGPNGAGKTTLIRVLGGLLRPSEGDALIGGRSFAADGMSIRRSIGLVGHQSYLYPELTVGENLELYARLYRVRRRAERIRELLERIGLSDRRADRVRSLSRGMTQRLTLARALLHDPAVLLLDEPDAGLDADAFAILEEILLSASARGRTTLLTTHDLDHALRLADRVAILRDGRIVDESSTGGLGVAALRERYARATAPRR
jgi:heme exporter protein A